jgi:DNA-binding SARP family transcriptional activator
VIYCRALGPVAVTLDGDPPPRELLWRKNLALLVYLGRSTDRRRTRTHLRGLLWGDKPEAAARHSLNEAVRVLRRVAGEDLIESLGEQIILSENSLHLDTDDFEDLVAVEDWAGAAQLVGGVFLEGFEVPDSSGFEDWLAAERSAWLRRSVDCLVHHAEHELSRGDSSAAARASHRALSMDPVSDAAVRAAMRVTALSGERASALDLFEAFAERIRRGLDTEPEPETQRLADRIRLERVWKISPDAKRTEPFPERAPLFGRAEELQRSVDALGRCFSTQRATAVFVLGGAGLGKTRLATEILGRARLDGAFVAATRVVPGDHEEPWSGVLGLLRAGLATAPGVLAAPAPSLAAAAEQITAWRERFAAEIEGVTPAPLRRALVDVLRAIAEEQPAVAFIDDAEWLDQESAQALAAALRDLADLPFALVLAANPHPGREELDEIRSRIDQHVNGELVLLERLSREDLADLTRWTLPDYGPESIERLSRRLEVDAAGLPLLATEILGAVRLGLELSDETAPWPEPQKTLDQTLPADLPDSVISSIRMRFRRLGPRAQSVLEAAAVLGERVNDDTLARVTGLSSDELDADLDELEWQRWLAADPGGYVFVARILRDVVARDMVLPGRRDRILKRARS